MIMELIERNNEIIQWFESHRMEDYANHMRLNNETLIKLDNKTKPRQYTFAEIWKAVEIVTNFTREEIVEDSRKLLKTDARKIFVLCAYKSGIVKKDKELIRELNGRDRSTILHARQSGNELYESDSYFKEKVDATYQILNLK